MKKYKSNHMVTIMFQLCNMFLITFPGVFIMWLLLNPDDQQGVLYIFPTYGLLILFFIVFGNLIHFITALFTKHKVFIYDNKVEIKGKKIITNSMNLDDIKHIIIDQGTITKYGGGTAFSINLFNDNYSDSLQINNPSFFMILCLIKNCKNAKVKFNNYKWYIVSCILFTVFAIAICIIGKNA